MLLGRQGVSHGNVVLGPRALNGVARESPPERRPPRYFKITTSCFGMLSKTAEARGGPKTRPPQYSIRKTVCFGRLSKTVEARGGPRRPA